MEAQHTKTIEISGPLVASIYKPSNLGGWSFEDHGSRISWTKQDPISTKIWACLSSQLCGKLRSGGLWFQAITGKTVCETPSQQKIAGMVSHTYSLSYGGKHKIGRLQSRWVWAESETLSPK
jgi:hypothetical protein